MKELDMLLDNYWILKDRNKELYYQIKDSIPKYKDFLAEKLGYHVIVNPYMIKLEKFPGRAEPWMGIQCFECKLEYIFFCLLLMFLEDKSKYDQFVLSQVTDFIQASCPGDEKADWTLFRHRKSLIKVLRFACDMGMMYVDDGNDNDFTNDVSSEVLYESTGISRYFTRNFVVDIFNISSYHNIEDAEFMDIDIDKGSIRSQRVFRRVLMSPIVYCQGANDPDYAYIKNFRNTIQSNIEKYFDADFHVHKNGALMVLPENHVFKDCFPDSKAISDIILQLNMLITKELSNGSLSKDKDDIITISKPSFDNLIATLKSAMSMGWSKEYREMDIDTLIPQILKCCSHLLMLEQTDDGKSIRILPLSGKIAGCYPNDFKSNSESEAK